MDVVWLCFADGVTISTEVNSEGLVTATAELELTALPDRHKSLFVCQATHDALPPDAAMRANFSLNVLCKHKPHAKTS